MYGEKRVSEAVVRCVGTFEEEKGIADSLRSNIAHSDDQLEVRTESLSVRFNVQGRTGSGHKRGQTMKGCECDEICI